MFILHNRVSGQAVHFAVYDSFAHLERRLQEDTNKVIVVNFWATWCKPCVEELPYFETLQQQYADKSVRVLLVSLDFKSQKEKRLRPFLIQNPMQSEVALLADQDADYWIPRMHRDWDGAIPATLVIGPYKRAKGFHREKFDNYEELEIFVNRFLE